MAKITGKFNWQTPEIIPAFVQGADAKAIYDATKGIRTGDMGYDGKNRLFYGSTVFVAARIDTLVRPLGMRVATLRDLSRPEVMKMIQSKYYSDTPALIVRSAKDSNANNLPLIEKLVQEAEKRNVSLPFMVSGFDVIQDSNREGYGLTFIPREDFAVVYDKRLQARYNNKKFFDVDEIGLPKFDKNGSRTWYARNQGLSRLYLFRHLNLYSDNGDLADSGEDGRVVLVRDENADLMRFALG